MLPAQLSKRVVFLRRYDILSYKLCWIKLYQFLSKCICTTGADGSFGWTHFLLSMSCIACILVRTCIKLDQHLVTFGTFFGSKTQVSKSGINLCDALCEKSWFVFFNTCFKCNLHHDLTHRTISTHGSLCFPKPVWLLEPPCTHWRPEGSIMPSCSILPRLIYKNIVGLQVATILIPLFSSGTLRCNFYGGHWDASWQLYFGLSNYDHEHVHNHEIVLHYFGAWEEFGKAALTSGSGHG